MVFKRIESSAYYAMHEHEVHSRVFNETKQFLSVPEARDFLATRVIDRNMPHEWVYEGNLVGVYLLQHKRAVLGSFFEKTLQLRAYVVDEGAWRGQYFTDACLLCDEWVQFPVVSGSGEIAYLLGNRDRRIRDLLSNPERFYVPANARLSIDMGGTIATGRHATEIGLMVCAGCAMWLQASDPHEESLLGMLLAKADKAHAKVLYERAIADLSFGERWRLQVEKANAADAKKRLIRGIESRVAVKMVLGADGVLREVETEE